MSLTIGKTPLSSSVQIFNDRGNKLISDITTIFDNNFKPSNYEEISPNDSFFDKIQKSWNNSTAYMPESGKKGWDLFNAKVHNFIAALTYSENPFGMREFISMNNRDHARLC